MKTIPMEEVMSQVISEAGSCASSLPAEQALPLSIEETGEPGVQEQVSVEESGSHDTSDLYVLGECFHDIHEGKVTSKIKTYEPQNSVPFETAGDVDPQDSPSQGLDLEQEGSSKAPSHEEEAKQGIVEHVPTGGTPIFPEELINRQLTGITEIQPPHVPSADRKEKKKKRRPRRKPVEKTVEQFFNRSFLDPRSMLTRVQQFSPKMPSGLKAFGTTHLFEIVNGAFLTLFRSCAPSRAVVDRGAILILLFLLIFHSTAGLKRCEHLFNSTTAIDCPVTLMDSQGEPQPACNLMEIAPCPQRTKCLNNIDLCLRNNYSLIFYFFEEDAGLFYLEFGKISDSQEIVHLVNEDCREYSISTPRTSMKDPQHETNKTDPTTLPGDETSTVHPGVIVGCVIAVLAAVGVTIWWCCRRRQRKKESMKCCLTAIYHLIVQHPADIP